MTDPRERALEVIRIALLEQVELMVALQFTGMLVPDALKPLRESRPADDLIARILSVPAVPDPDYAKPRVIAVGGDPVREVYEQPRRRRPRPAPSLLDVERNNRQGTRIVGGTQGTLFARWVEGEIDLASVSVMGWTSDDPRSEAMYGVEDGRVSEQRTLTIPHAPPRRLMYETRFRALKLIADRQVWAAAQDRIDELTNEGWQVEKVKVDWGANVPGLGAEREAWLTKLFDGAVVEEQVSGIKGRGTTTVHLRRGEA